MRVQSARRRAPARLARASHSGREHVDGQQYAELRRGRTARRGTARRRRATSSPPRRRARRAIAQAERRPRVRERLLDQERRVGERRRRDRADRGEDRPGPRDDEAREPVRGEDRRRHHEHADQLGRVVRRRVGSSHQAGCDRDRCRARSGAAARRAATAPGLGDRARDLGELDLVGEDRRRPAPPRLPGVERAGRAKIATNEEPADSARAASARTASCGALTRRRARARRRGRGRARADEAARRRPRPLAGGAHEVEPLRAASGIVTSTSRPCGRSSRRSISSRAPSTATPWIRRRRAVPGCRRGSRRRARRRLAQLARKLRPELPAPTISVRAAAPRRSEPSAATSARSPKRDGADQRRAEQRVDHEDLEREVGQRPNSSTMPIRERHRRRATAPAIATRSRAPAKRQIRAVDAEERRRRRSGRRAGSAAREEDACAGWSSRCRRRTSEVRRQERDADERRSPTSTSTSRRRLEKSAPERRLRPRLGASAPQIAEEAGELDEHDERDQHADGGDARRSRARCSASSVAPSAAASERQQRRRPAARRGRSRRAGARSGRVPPWVTGRRSSVRRTVTSVVSRIGTASTSSGSTRRRQRRPRPSFQLDASASEARPKPITWLPESPMKTAARRPGRRLKGRKPSAGAAERERERRARARLESWSTAATAKYGAGDWPRASRRDRPCCRAG